MSHVKHTHDHMQILCTNMVDKLGQCKLVKSVFSLVKILKIFAGSDINNFDACPLAIGKLSGSIMKHF